MTLDEAINLIRAEVARDPSAPVERTVRAAVLASAATAVRRLMTNEGVRPRGREQLHRLRAFSEYPTNELRLFLAECPGNADAAQELAIREDMAEAQRRG